MKAHREIQRQTLAQRNSKSGHGHYFLPQEFESCFQTMKNSEQTFIVLLEGRI